MRRLLAVLVAALAAVPPVLLTAQPAVAATTAPSLVIGSDFPDPDVLKVGSTYYAYSTNNGYGNVPVATAGSLYGPWTRQGNALPTLGAWAGGGRTWAPDVSQRSDGTYLMYYTAYSNAVGRQCIGAALASSPLGPFSPVGTGPLVCNGGEGGDIVLEAAAARHGQSLRQYLLELVETQARHIRNIDVLERFAGRSGGTRSLPGETAADLAEERTLREQWLSSDRDT